MHFCASFTRYFGAYYDEETNKIHLLLRSVGHNMHLIYDIDQKQCTAEESRIIYRYAACLPDKSKFLLMMQKGTDLCYELYRYDVTSCDLNKLNIAVLEADYVRNAIVIYDVLLLVLADDGIWIADTECNKWYKNKKIMPGFISTQTINSKDNYIHFIGGLNDDNYLYHLKVDLFDLIPKDLVDYHSKHLCSQFVTECINYNKRILKLDNKCPHALTSIILSFFPVFLY
eukprot:UN02662